MASSSAVASMGGNIDLATANTVNGLRKLAASDPVRAQEDAWALFKQLGKSRDEAALNSMFGMGTSPRGLHGPTDGILVATFTLGILNFLARIITAVWMPWLGKQFDRNTMTGTNRMSPGLFTRIVLKIIFPLYSLRRSADGTVTAFEFENANEPGRYAPVVEVFKIDYAPVKSNPWLVISKIRDELVEITPDTYLGRILWHHGGERYSNLGFFALRQPAGKR